MADYIRPTPRNPILGLLADALTGGVDWMRDPRRTQQMQGLGGLLAETGIPASVERLSYGEPLTKGSGMTTRLRPEAESALMTLGPEAVPIGRGAMAAVKATKGLPVGASVKPLNLSEGVFKPELTMQEMLRVKDIPTVQRMQKSMDLVGEKNFKGMVEDIFKKYKPTDQDQEAMLVEAVTLDILGRANRNPDLLRGLPGLKTPAPQEEALRLAQQRAALPVSEGGLGLPPNNTPMDRARAMGFGTESFHGTKADVQLFDKSKNVTAKDIYSSPNPVEAGAYAEGVGGNVMPLLLRGDVKDLTTDSKYVENQLRKAYNAQVSKYERQYYPFEQFAESFMRGQLYQDTGGQSAQNALVSELIGNKKSILKIPDAVSGGGIGESYVVADPSKIRSRFAAFDPTRRNEPDLLAGALPFTALLDEENRARLEEQLGGLLGR